MKSATRIARAADPKAATPLKRLLDRAADFSQPRMEDEQWATSPYTQTGPYRERTDPRDASVFLFPAGEPLRTDAGFLRQPSAARVMEHCSQVLRKEVSEMGAWTRAVSLSSAAVAVARETHAGTMERARAAAGRGAGEVAALVFAGAVHLDDALRLCELVEAAMAAVRRERGGGSMQVWLSADHRLGALMQKTGLRVAAHLYPHSKVLSGGDEGLRFLREKGNQFGVVRAKGVSDIVLSEGADSMRAAVREALKYIRASAPALPVLSAANVQYYRCAEDVPRRLSRALVSPQCWEQSLHHLFARPDTHTFPRTLCIGKDTRRQLRMVNAKAWDSSILYDA